MRPGRYELRLQQGATNRRVVTWTDVNDELVDLTGYSARLHIRDGYASATPLLELTNGAGITLGGAAGTVTIEITPAMTEGDTWRSGVYDLELESAGGAVTRLLEGKAVLTPEVTREDP